MSEPLDLDAIERTHRHAMATRSTPTDSWLNGYQEDVGALLAEVRRLRDALQKIERESHKDWRYAMQKIARAALGDD